MRLLTGTVKDTERQRLRGMFNIMGFYFVKNSTGASSLFSTIVGFDLREMTSGTGVFEGSWRSRAPASFKWYRCGWNGSAQVDRGSRGFVTLEVFPLYV
jgi:hypothetical protein